METLAEMSHRLQRGKADPVEQVEQVLHGFASSAGSAIAIEIFAERARREAKAARRRLKAGRPLSRLDGVPVGWKALFDVKGHVTTVGSALFQQAAPAPEDAALVAAAAEAGLVSIASLNMTEFAFSALGLNPHFGTPQNAHAQAGARVPGGSSSGSAVAVAKGLLPLAMGTDTGGSVRIPASFNGIVGYKSSTGHYPMRGVFPLSKTYDTLGPLAQTVEDCALADAVLRGIGFPRLRRAGVKGQVFYVPKGSLMEGLDAAVLRNFEAALSRIGRAGGKIKALELPAIAAAQALMAKHGNINLAEAYHVHHDRVNGPQAAQIDARVVQRILQGQKMSAHDLLTVQETRAGLIAATEGLMGDGFVVLPTTAKVAPALADVEQDVAAFSRENLLALRNTAMGNFMDWCGLSIPSGTDAQGLPTGFMLSARHGRDAALLALGLELEPLVRG